jgi:hypothetical protein
MMGMVFTTERLQGWTNITFVGRERYVIMQDGEGDSGAKVG